MMHVQYICRCAKICIHMGVVTSNMVLIWSKLYASVSIDMELIEHMVNVLQLSFVAKKFMMEKFHL